MCNQLRWTIILSKSHIITTAKSISFYYKELWIKCTLRQNVAGHEPCLDLGLLKIREGEGYFSSSLILAPAVRYPNPFPKGQS